MKKIILTVITAILAMTCMSGCFRSGGNSVPGVRTDEAVDAASLKVEDYKNDLSGLEDYLKALKYIPADCEPTKMMYTVIGAKDGDRLAFTVDNAAVSVELYEYDTDNLNEDAKRVIAEVKKDGKYSVFGEMGKEDDAEFEAALSANGKYLVSYVISSDGDSNVQRKKDFINAVKEFKK